MSGPVFIAGGTGQLGHELQLAARRLGVGHAVVSRPVFDFEKPDSIDECFAKAAPALVVNAAAYTAVDAAQTNPLAARAGNHTGPWRLAQLCQAAGIPLIHISTDYVFDGTKGAPYVETDETAPACVYGQTKRDGELAILETGARAIILRTSWVYGTHGKNFVRTMLNAGRKVAELKVVADQRGAPTAAVDLAAGIFGIIGILQSQSWNNDYGGIYHATGAGETNWHEFANAIFAAAGPDFSKPLVHPITTAQWPTPARRPADSRLNCDKLANVFGIRLADWRLTLPHIVQALLADGQAA